MTTAAGRRAVQTANRSSRASMLAALAMLTLAATGCGESGGKLPNRVPVSGRVTVAGRPLAYGTVQFVPDDPDGHSAMGGIKAGSFRMESAESFPGVVKGPYKVSIVSPQPIDPTNRPADMFSPEANRSNIPKRYGNPDTSGLSVDVTAATSDLVFDLQAE